MMMHMGWWAAIFDVRGGLSQYHTLLAGQAKERGHGEAKVMERLYSTISYVSDESFGGDAGDRRPRSRGESPGLHPTQHDRGQNQPEPVLGEAVRAHRVLWGGFRSHVIGEPVGQEG